MAGAFITTALADGRPGVRELRGRVFRFRVNPIWYVVALFGLPLVAVATAAIATTSNPVAAVIGHPDVMLGTVVAGAVVAFLLVNWWEEVGWTGFALERLQPKLGPIGASVVTTWLQALLHLPLVFVVGGVTVGRVPADLIPFYLVALFIFPISVRILITWIYNMTGRSVPIVGLFHAGLGVASNPDFTTVLIPGFAAGLVYAGFAVVAVAGAGHHQGPARFRRHGDPRRQLTNRGDGDRRLSVLVRDRRGALVGSLGGRSASPSSLSPVATTGHVETGTGLSIAARCAACNSQRSKGL